MEEFLMAQGSVRIVCAPSLSRCRGLVPIHKLFSFRVRSHDHFGGSVSVFRVVMMMMKSHLESLAPMAADCGYLCDKTSPM